MQAGDGKRLLPCRNLQPDIAERAESKRLICFRSTVRPILILILDIALTLVLKLTRILVSLFGGLLRRFAYPGDIIRVGVAVQVVARSLIALALAALPTRLERLLVAFGA